MKKNKIKNCGLFILLLVIVASCAPKALYMEGGEKLHTKIKSEKVKVAVLPAVDWAEDEGCCRGWFLYGCSGLLDRDRAYKDGGWILTNSLISSLWKKNKFHLVKKDTLIKTLKKNKLTKSQIFPKHKTIFCGTFPKPISNANNVGTSNPDYDKLYKVGEEMQADILIISRMTRSTKTGLLPQNPVGTLFPVSTAISAGQYIYRAVIKKTKNYYVAIDIMALDVKNNEVIAFGGYNKINQIPESQENKAMDQYTKAITFYAPKPAKSDLEKDFLANSASMGTTLIANAIVQNITGLSLAIRFKFDYEYGDETWKMYPKDHFMKNYGLTKSEYFSLL